MIAFLTYDQQDMPISAMTPVHPADENARIAPTPAERQASGM